MDLNSSWAFFLLVGLSALVLFIWVEVRRSHRLVAVFTLDTTNASIPEAWKKDVWKVDEHRGLGVVEVRFAGGEMYIDGRKVGEYIAKNQKQGIINGHNLRKEFADKPVLPDALLDLLIREQDNPTVGLYLKKYRGRCPCFWGTIYQYSENFLCVRCLDLDGERFGWCGIWLGIGWPVGNPALVLAPAAGLSK